MRTHALRIVCALALLAVGAVAQVQAQGKAPKEVKELSELRKQYDKRVETALAPVDIWYADQLGKLAKRLSDAGDLDSALVVRAEMNALDTVKSASGLVILSAVYGSATKKADVTDRVQMMVQGNKLALASSAFDEMLGDPHPWATKVLTIRYRYDGRTRTFKVSNAERKDVSLP